MPSQLNLERELHIHLHIYGMNRLTNHWQAFFIRRLSDQTYLLFRKVQIYYAVQYLCPLRFSSKFLMLSLKFRRIE